MVDSIARQSHPGQALYADELNRLAWREKMLTQMLDKVRAASTEVNKVQIAAPAHPVKGSLLDVYA
ncbi:MAG: hypothetical protein JRI95_13555 [Deltaproteobacteria bacterium]|nr:hypothetical protein [Deltaproteobacteria bacterium]